MFLPWKLRRRCLTAFLGYEIAPDAHIGYSWVAPEILLMASGARIGHLTVCKGLARLEMGASSSIGRLNWITGYPIQGTVHFTTEPLRDPSLVLGPHSAITNRHIIDCTALVTIGAFTTIAGFRTQILTHSIDLARCVQRSSPVEVGEYSFVGSGCILLAGTQLPSRSLLAAGSVLTKRYEVGLTLYAGAPARAVKSLPEDAEYFKRVFGFVV